MNLSSTSIADAFTFQVDAELIQAPESLSAAMNAVNDLCDANGQLRKFVEVDIQFQTFLDRMDLTQKERDLIYVANFFYRAYQILHVDIAVHSVTPSPYDINVIKQTYASLVRLGQEFTLTNNLRKTLIKKWCM